MAYKTCVICGEKILPTETSVPYKGRFVHSRCFNKTMKAMTQNKQKQLAESSKKPKKSTAKTKTELKDGMSEEEYAKKKQFFDYLKEIADEEHLSVKQVAVAEKYIERYNFTYEGMYQTLVYMNEIIHKDLTGDVVGIIPYYYSEAMHFQEELDDLEKVGKDFSFRGKYKTKIVKTNTMHRRKNYQPMDVLSIGE